MQLLPEIIDARAMALGGAARSLPATAMAARMNPAALAPMRGFWTGVSYLTRNEPVLDALRVTQASKVLRDALGGEFIDSYCKLKTAEWDRYASHLTQWERDNTLDC